MPKYIVSISERYYQDWEVDADTPQEATRTVNSWFESGDTDHLVLRPYYDSTDEPSQWLVEEITPKNEIWGLLK